MLVHDLGYRPPTAGEQVEALFRKSLKRRWSYKASAGKSHLPSAILHGRPLISYSGITPNAPLGLASVLGPRLALQPAYFLLSPTWSIEDRLSAVSLRRAAVRHRLVNPQHRIVFACNTQDETALMRSLGEAAFTHNKTTNTSEHVFRPLDDVTPEFDAIYNAQLAPWKRHELALAIPTCAFLFYRGVSSTAESEAALIARHLSAAPAHVFVNQIDGKGTPVRLDAEAVNRQLNRASVGLCLSEKEGAMFACAEYLLAGLPVVTTPNTGGRNFFLDGETCITADADPQAIASAVASLKERALPRAHVREKALALINAERARFIDLVNAIHAELGIADRFHGFWPLKRPVVMEWLKPRHARSRALAGTADEIADPHAAARD